LDQQKKIVQEAQDRLDRDGYFIQTRYGSGPHPAIRVQREATMTMMAIQRAMRISNKQGDDRAGWDPLNDE
jgi:hypothetical protein